ncbi:hypothetical protein ACIP95_18520 [Micromonospora parva]|uniref:hypothetical protein n=1 Tax=Micromonospora parva TaxID=1464048 RepID=UPI003804C691
MLSFVIAATADDSPLSASKLAVPAFAALLGFVSGYLLEIIKSKRGSRTLLSWDLRVEEPEISYGAAQADRIKISYRGHEVDRLVNVRYTITNSGNTAIKNQIVRFVLPEDAKILQRELDPTPDPELGVRDITGQDPEFVGPRYKVAQLDPGDSVSFALAADGGSWRGWNGVKLRNEDAGIVYQRRDVALRRDDQTHVAPFLFGLASIFIVATLTGAMSLALWILGKFYWTELAYFGIIVMLTILFAAAAAYLLSHARRATRVIAQRLAAGARSDASLSAYGEKSWFAYAPNGSIRIGSSDASHSGDGS